MTFRLLLLHLGALLFCFPLYAGDLPHFGNDAETDQWLRQKSQFYAQMASDVDARGSYRFTVQEATPRAGDVHFENGQRFIALGSELEGAERVSVLIFEMTNAFQEPHHHEVDARARAGSIADPIQFGMMHELVEYDGLRYHRKVLAELETAIGGVPTPMLTWINPGLTTLASYELPLAFDYMEAQAKSGHTAHYHRWFWKQKESAGQ